MGKAKLNLTGLAVLLLAFGGMYPLVSSAQNISNGYICDSKNPGGEGTRRFYRETDGQAVNISPNETFPVVCPVPRVFGKLTYDIVIRLSNGGTSVNQTIACALEEYDLGSFLVRTVGRSKNYPPLWSEDLSWMGYRLADEVNYLVVRCILPPRSYVGLFAWE